MNYVLIPSLEHIAAVRIALALWGHNDIGKLIARFHPSLDRDKEEWLKIKINDKILKKASRLPLPELLNEKALGFVNLIGIQILKWQTYHYEFIDLSSFGYNFNKLHWTPQGTINMEKTAEMLITDNNLHVFEQYKLACICCLEDYIYALWQQLKVVHGKDLLRTITRVNESPLISFWSYYVEGRISDLESIIKKSDVNNTLYEYAFEIVAVSGNIAGTKYFLQKLTVEEKERVLARIAKNVAVCHCQYSKGYHAEILCFLLAHMSEEQKIHLLKNYPSDVLKCFLDWPLQDYFIKIVNHALDFVSEENYASLLWRIVHEDHRNCDYKKLFRLFWQQGSSTNKQYAMFQGMGLFMLFQLFNIEDKENIKLIFRDSCIIAGKMELISHGIAQGICDDLAHRKKWDLLNFFIEECIPYNDIIIKLKEEFEEPIKYASSKEKLRKINEERDKLCQLLDNFIERNSE